MEKFKRPDRLPQLPPHFCSRVPLPQCSVTVGPGQGERCTSCNQTLLSGIVIYKQHALIIYMYILHMYK